MARLDFSADEIEYLLGLVEGHIESDDMAEADVCYLAQATLLHRRLLRAFHEARLRALDNQEE